MGVSWKCVGDQKLGVDEFSVRRLVTRGSDCVFLGADGGKVGLQHLSDSFQATTSNMDVTLLSAVSLKG